MVLIILIDVVILTWYLGLGNNNILKSISLLLFVSFDVVFLYSGLYTKRKQDQHFLRWRYYKYKIIIVPIMLVDTADLN